MTDLPHPTIDTEREATVQKILNVIDNAGSQRYKTACVIADRRLQQMTYEYRITAMMG